jgi:hypothetical protein
VAPAIEFLKHHLKATPEGRRSMEVESFIAARLAVPLVGSSWSTAGEKNSAGIIG